MDILEKNQFHFIDETMIKELVHLNKNLIPLMIKYAGMGYSYIFAEKDNLYLEKRFIILTIGGSNSIESEYTMNIYKEYNGPFYSLNECAKYSNKLPDP
jgi:hypothetical protein